MKKAVILILSFVLFACNRGPSAEAYVTEGNKGLIHKIPYHEALADYNAAIELKPEYAIAYANRGQLEIKMHNFYGAQNDLQKALSLDHKMVGVYYYLGYAKEQVGDHEGSQLSYTQAIEHNPRDAKAYADRAYVRQILKDQKGALQDFNTAILIKPDSFPDVYKARGLLKIKMNDKNGGCLDLHHAFKLQPDSITGHYIDINCK
jgi:tetratricopeptide (TPR) repeat protein